jgi:S-adenosylmethionine hydrolase
MTNKVRGKNTREQGSKGSGSRVPASGGSRAAAPLITLLTDFGTADYFVAAVKGVILSLNPDVRIVDITHEIPPQDIEAAAFTLLAAQPAFPLGTIHVAVVDPGVGSSRRAILLQTRQAFFVGPDNGIFSYVCETQAKLGFEPDIFHLTNEKYFRQPVSATFNGRDVFAPVAAALSLGVKPSELGTRVPDFIHLLPLKPEITTEGKINARIIHIDRFGNCVTNITPGELTQPMIAARAKLSINRKLVKSFRQYFAEESGDRKKLFAIWGSAGFLEIAATNASAAKLLKAKRGDAVIVS